MRRNSDHTLSRERPERRGANARQAVIAAGSGAPFPYRGVETEEAEKAEHVLLKPGRVASR